MAGAISESMVPVNVPIVIFGTGVYSCQGYIGHIDLYKSGVAMKAKT